MSQTSSLVYLWMIVADAGTGGLSCSARLSIEKAGVCRRMALSSASWVMGKARAVIGLRAAELVEDRVKVGIIGHASSLLGGAKGTRLECG